MSDNESANAESEIGSRLEQIQEIVSRRAELLRQMHQIYKRRENIGSGLLLDHNISDADAEARFLSRFDLEKNPTTGFASLSEHDSIFVLPSSSRTQDTIASSSRGETAKEDSPMSYSEDEIDLLGHPQPVSVPAPARSPKSATTTTLTLEDDQAVEDELLKGEAPSAGPDAMMIDEPSEALPLSTSKVTKTIHITFPPSQTRPPIIPAPKAPLKSIEPVDPSALPTKFDVEAHPPVTVDPKEFQLKYKPEYTLPPVKMLPAEFRRNAKPAKLQRKKEKEKEKGESGKKDNKDDWVPAGIAKLDVSLRLNSVTKRIRHSMKCVNTREWEIAMAEIKLVRTLDRIESLKDASRWSFRQPKKQQRGSTMTTKTHWDYLLDEMKWMRTDFREERKWKMALAFDISTAVLLWHEAGSAEKRIRQGICVLWKGSRNAVDAADQDVPMSAVEPDELGDSTKISFAMPEDDEDEDDEDDQDDQPRVIGEASESAVTLEDYLPSSQTDTPGIGMKDLEPKKEDTDENASAFLDIPATPLESQPETPALAGLKPDSVDPTLPRPEKLQSDVLPADTAITRKGKSSKLSTYAPLREKIVYSDLDKFFITPEDLQFQPLGGEDAPLSSIDLNTIFADLQIVGIPEPPPPAEDAALVTKKKSGKSESDAHKRVDEVAQTKVYPASEFMYTKPVLLGALEPFKHWKDGKWTGWDDGPVSVDVDGYTAKPASECFSDLFDYSKPPINFPRLISKWEKTREKANEQDGEFAAPTLRHLWTSADDTLLKTISDRHPDNWKLIAESFNSSRFTIGADRRTDVDCYERWKEVFAQPMLKGMADAPENPTPPSTPAAAATSPTMTTRGIKRSHQASISISTGPTATASEPKKRRRHQLVHDFMRKTAKKKSEALQKAALTRKGPVVHDTHAQYSKLPRLSPGELSRVKQEKDTKEVQERMARLQHQQRMNAPAVPQINGQSAPQQVALQRTPSNGGPVPVNPQLRPSQVNISQQPPRMSPQNNVAVAPNGSRMSSQQLMQARQQLNQPMLTHQQQQQQQQLAQAIAQVQAQTQNQTAPNGNGVTSMSPPPAFSIAGVSRDASASPAQNGTPSATPRPPSAQAVQQPNGATPIPASSQRAYYMPNVNMSNYSAEQMAQLRNIQLSMLQQQQQQQASAIPHQNGSYAQPPPQT